MKVIDLLVKIANGEEVPKTIFYSGHFFTKENGCPYQDEDKWNFNNYIELDSLNDEVEIIEEDKKIALLPMIEEDELFVERLEINQTRRKINEIIEVINGRN